MRTIATKELKTLGLKWRRIGDEPYDHIVATDSSNEIVAVYNSNVWPENDWQLWELTKHGESMVKP